METTTRGTDDREDPNDPRAADVWLIIADIGQTTLPAAHSHAAAYRSQYELVSRQPERVDGTRSVGTRCITHCSQISRGILQIQNLVGATSQ
eukprot:SAG31_NODE_1359_length_8639_cov_3.889813_2_plen_92_part_00